jgi:hypothetical protein
MNKQTILNRINALLSAPVKLAQMKLDNGTVIEAESFTVGAEVYAIDGENKTPLEVGSYILEDGTTLEVTEIGIIGEVASKATEDTAEMKAEMESQKEEALIMKIAESLKPTFDAMNEKIENLSKVNTELKATLSKVSAPKTVVAPTEPKKVNFSAVNTKENLSSTEARIMAMLAN